MNPILRQQSHRQEDGRRDCVVVYLNQGDGHILRGLVGGAQQQTQWDTRAIGQNESAHRELGETI